MEPPPDVAVRSVDFVRTFPWLRLGRAVGIAVAPQQVAIGLAVALLLAVLQLTVFTTAEPRPVLIVTFAGLTVSLSDLVRPVWDVIQPLLLIRLPNSWATLRLLETLAVFVVWTLAGVALCRCAAVQFCREESPSLRGSVQWSAARMLGSLTAIVTPLGGAAVLLAIAAVIAIPSAMPGAGLIWMQVAAPVQFVLGIAAGFILVLLPLLWPLMVAAVAVDSSDAFDAFSRSFSLVTSRLWSTLGLLLMAAVSGLVVTLAFRWLLEAGIAAVVWAAAWTTTEVTTTRTAVVLHWWREVGYRGLCGSLFWTHTTIIYLFLRELVDAVPWFSLAGYADPKPAFDPYPVVGMAAMKPPETALKVAEAEVPPEIGGEG